MKIAVFASEGAPYAKSGGLGDVMEALPAALQRIADNEVVLFLPGYKGILENPALELVQVANISVPLGWRQSDAAVLQLKNPAGGVQVYFIHNLQYFGGRNGAIYGHSDDGERFAYFSKACLLALPAISFMPQVIHCNDWQTAAVPLWLQALYRPQFPHTKTVLTIHNVEYQGWADASFFDDVLALPDQWRSVTEMNGAVNLLKSGILCADRVTTVSETYARELKYPYFAHGMDSVIRDHAYKLTGITNGIDMQTFNPATDPALPANYHAGAFVRNKAKCKGALQQALGLPVQPKTPLMVLVSRLVEHKGLDLLCAIARQLLQQDVQLVILGAGEQRYEQFFRDLAAEFPDKVASKILFDIPLASRIYAGGDIYLMPSRSEPCGLSQMNAMRYGTIPVVHATGGLKDTVPGADENGEGGLGFTFQSFDPADFYDALHRCLALYRNQPKKFRALQKTCMEQDFSWDSPAEKYMNLFAKF